MTEWFGAKAGIAARASLALILSCLAACGGSDKPGSSAPTYSISLSTSSLSFNGTVGTPVPSQTVLVTYNGDGVVVGTLPGQSSPSWLTVTQASAPSGGQVSFQISVAPFVTSGTYATTLRFVTGAADGSNVAFADLQVSFQQRQAFGLTGTSQSFQGMEGGTTATRTSTAALAVVGDNVSWRATSNQPWVQITSATGTAAGPIAFTVNPSGLTGSFHTAQISVFDSVSARTLTATVQLSLQLRPPFALNGTSQLFQGIEGATTATRTSTTALAVTGDNVSWRATSNQPWVQITSATGTAAGPIAFTVNPSGLTGSSHSAQISVVDSVSARTLTASVQLSLRAPQFLTSATSLTITVDTTTLPTQLPTSFTISDELGGANAAGDYAWSITSRSNLVRTTPATGRTSPAATEVIVDLDPARWSALKTGQVSTQLEVAHTRRGITQTRLIPLTINVRLPTIGSAYPFVVAPNVAGRTTIIGSGLEDRDMAGIRIGGQTPTAIRRQSSQVVEIDYPALTPGQHPITLANGLGIPRSVAEVSAIGSVVVGTGEVSNAGGKKVKLLFDGSRGVLYAADFLASEVQRYQWSGSAFQNLPAVAVPSVRDIALARNNRELYAVSFAGIYSIDMTNFGSVVAQRRVADVDISCNGALYRLTVPENGTLLSSPFGYGCYVNNLYGTVLSIDLLTWAQGLMQTPTNLVNADAPSIAASPTGRYVAVGNTSTSSGTYFLQDMRTNAALDSGSYSRYSWYYYHALDVNEAGNRVLFHAFNSYRVRDALGTTVCFISGTPAVARLSADGNKAYAYLHADGGAGRIAVYNTNTGTPLGGACTEITAESVAVPFVMGTMTGDLPYEPNFVMTLDESQRRIFLAGPSRIVALAMQ